ncbi:hypothetical protein AALB52_02535 [Lachnospiraceae bacterium 38-14]
MSMDIFSVNYQAMVEKARTDLKEIENKGVSKAETLEDLRDTKGKSFLKSPGLSKETAETVWQL